MALFPGTKMVFWKIKFNGLDIGGVIKSVINSISIKDTVLSPTRKNSKKIHAPSEATISISSKDYIEDFFVEGSEISIYLGYDRFSLPLVFRGEIKTLPEGDAREMLSYTVKAYGNGLYSANTEKNRIFQLATKEA